MPEPCATDSSQAVAILDHNAAIASDTGWAEQNEQWNSLIRTGILPPHVKTSAIAITISRFGAEVFGWGPMASVMKLNIIKGKVTLWAEALMGLMQEHCHRTEDLIWPVERSLERAAIATKRAGHPDHFVFEFTQTMAKTAGLWGKDNWAKYPEAMLWARSVSIVSRGTYADVTGGAFAREEFTPERVTVSQMDDTDPLGGALEGPNETPTQ